MLSRFSHAPRLALAFASASLVGSLATISIRGRRSARYGARGRIRVSQPDDQLRAAQSHRAEQCADGRGDRRLLAHAAAVACGEDYSPRRTATGSSRVARRAGIQQANKATVIRSAEIVA